MKTALCIGLGGFLGTLSRHYLATWIGKSPSGFPSGILLVNLSGCLLFGFLFAWFEASRAVSADLRLFLFAGFLGAFTTFSTFSHDTFTHLRAGQLTHAFGNIALSVGLGLFAVWLGITLASYLLPEKS